MVIFDIPSNYNFLGSVCDFIFEKSCDISIQDLVVFLPSRRSCNELKRLFLAKSKNDAVILPTIKAIGDVDYDDILLRQISKDDMGEFPIFANNTSRIRYKILLIRELLRWTKSSSKEIFLAITVEQVANLALEFEKFLDEVNKNGLDLDNLNDIVDEEYSKHWQEILNFLQVFGKKWNKFVVDSNIISLASYKTQMIEFNARFFEKNRPTNPIIMAGIDANTAAICRLIRSLLPYDNCYFLTKGLDRTLNNDEWESVDCFHPQYFIKKLLEKCLSVDRKQIKSINYPDNIVVSEELCKILSYSMLPYNFTHKWQDKIHLDEICFNNITKIECEDEFQELSIISYILKCKSEAKNIAVITKDARFAKQLEINLNGMGLSANNAFGNKISHTPFVKFFFLLLDVIQNDFESVALLSLLKHDFALFGHDKNDLNTLVLALEDKVLRKHGNIGINGLIKACDDTKLKDFLHNIRNKTRIKLPDTFQNILQQHLEIMEKIATNSHTNASDLFWNNTCGYDILAFFNEIIAESADYGIVKTLDEYRCLLNYLIAENSYSDKYSVHPFISIISPDEARLINYDLIVVANLNEGQFPPHITTDIWMSNSMRRSFGLPEKDELIGRFGYDFIQFLCNKEVILIRALKYEGTLTTKSKYLSRLETFLKCQNLTLREGNIWKEVWKKYNATTPCEVIKRPTPKPPLSQRPKELYATQLETLKNNPYDIYAKKILKLFKKDDFYKNKSFALFGSAVHQALELYSKNYPSGLSDEEKIATLMQYGKKSFDEYFIDPSSKEIFFIRFINIAKWFVPTDEKIRNNGYTVIVEETKKHTFKNLDFTVSAKIDRIEKNNLGEINICDYKTGTVPNNSNVISGIKPQLIIEAVILRNELNTINKLAYWSIKGKMGDNIQEITPQNSLNELIDTGEEWIQKLVAYFQVYENSYIATCYDLNNDAQRSSDYKHLSRVEEWGGC